MIREAFSFIFDLMITGFEKIVEARILEAQKKGDFDNLPGHGEPLELNDDSTVAEDLRLAYKILKNADCIPPELELRNEIKKTEDLLKNMPDTAEEYRLINKLNYLIMKLNSVRQKDIAFDWPQHYSTKLMHRCG